MAQPAGSHPGPPGSQGFADAGFTAAAGPDHLPQSQDAGAERREKGDELRLLLPALLAGLAIGVLIFLLRMTQSADSDLHLQRLANIRAINNLDVQLNRRADPGPRGSLSDEGDERVGHHQPAGARRWTPSTGAAVPARPQPGAGQGLDKFLDTIQSKFELDFDIEARSTLLNQRLIQTAPTPCTNIAALIAGGQTAIRAQLRDLGEQLNTQIVTFSVTPHRRTRKTCRCCFDSIDKLAPAQSDAFREALRACARAART